MDFCVGDGGDCLGEGKFWIDRADFVGNEVVELLLQLVEVGAINPGGAGGEGQAPFSKVEVAVAGCSLVIEAALFGINFSAQAGELVNDGGGDVAFGVEVTGGEEFDKVTGFAPLGIFNSFDVISWLGGSKFNTNFYPAYIESIIFFC